MDFSKQGHSVYYTRYYLVIATKYRRKVLKAGFGEYLKKLIIGLSYVYLDFNVLEINTDVDHIHILVSIPPKVSVSHVVKLIKAKTGFRMHKKFPFLSKVYWDKKNNLVARLFCFYSWDKRINNKKIY